MGQPMPKSQKVYSIEEAEEMLKNYRFSRNNIRGEVDEFISRLPEPYCSFAKFRYQHSETMENIAEELGYSTRTVYNFRMKVLRWWVLFLTGEQCS